MDPAARRQQLQILQAQAQAQGQARRLGQQLPPIQQNPPQTTTSAVPGPAGARAPPEVLSMPTGRMPRTVAGGPAPVLSAQQTPVRAAVGSVQAKPQAGARNRPEPVELTFQTVLDQANDSLKNVLVEMITVLRRGEMAMESALDTAERDVYRLGATPKYLKQAIAFPGRVGRSWEDFETSCDAMAALIRHAQAQLKKYPPFAESAVEAPGASSRDEGGPRIDFSRLTMQLEHYETIQRELADFCGSLGSGD